MSLPFIVCFLIFSMEISEQASARKPRSKRKNKTQLTGYLSWDPQMPPPMAALDVDFSSDDVINMDFGVPVQSQFSQCTFCHIVF